MIPLSAPDVSALELEYVADAVASTHLSSRGPFLDRFETSWAARCDVAHAVAVANGTAALTLAMRALGVAAGDEVVLPAFTFAAVAGAVVAAGAVPVFADVDPVTWCVDPASAAARVTTRTVGIVAVHAYGHPAPVGTLRAVADRHGLWLLEDGAEAHLATLDGRPVGGLADAAAFSFFGNKILSAGEGGAVTTGSGDLAGAVRTLANQGVAPDAPDRYSPVRVGTNERLTNVAAALLCAQLDRAEVLLGRRRAVEAEYRERASHLDLGWQGVAAGADPVPWLVTVTVGPDRDAVLADLTAAGVQGRRTFPAICDLDPYRAAADVPVSRALAAGGLSLPTHPGLTGADVATVVSALEESLVRCQPIGAAVR